MANDRLLSSFDSTGTAAAAAAAYFCTMGCTGTGAGVGSATEFRRLVEAVDEGPLILLFRLGDALAVAVFKGLLGIAGAAFSLSVREGFEPGLAVVDVLEGFEGDDSTSTEPRLVSVFGERALSVLLSRGSKGRR